MTTVSLINVSKNQGQHVILDKINLTIEKGEFIVVVGPSGCGKSTLLRLVAGLDLTSEGTILINDQCVNQIPAAERNIAMVFQNYALYPHMTVYQNMAYGLKMRGVKKEIICRRVAEVAEMLRLSEYLQRKPRELSGGQKQRVAMGRAIVRSPAVFLFDEPLSNLDTQLRSDMRHEIKKLYQQLNTTSIYVTHDHTEAMTLATRIVVLNEGRIEQVATPQQLYHQPASLFVARFTGHYPINCLTARIDYSNQQVVTTSGINLPLPRLQESTSHNDEVILAIRPEHIELTSRNAPMAIPVYVEWVDDMGIDKLVHVRSLCGVLNMAVRASSTQSVVGSEAAIKLNDQINLYNKKTGKCLGGWYGCTEQSIT